MSLNFRCDAGNIFTHFAITMDYLDMEKFWWWGSQSRKPASLLTCWGVMWGVRGGTQAHMRAGGTSGASSACQPPLTPLSQEQRCLHLSGSQMSQEKYGGPSAPSAENHSSLQQARREQTSGLVDFQSSVPSAASCLPSVCLLCLSGRLWVHVGKWKVL